MPFHVTLLLGLIYVKSGRICFPHPTSYLAAVVAEKGKLGDLIPLVRPSISSYYTETKWWPFGYFTCMRSCSSHARPLVSAGTKNISSFSTWCSDGWFAISTSVTVLLWVMFRLFEHFVFLITTCQVLLPYRWVRSLTRLVRTTEYHVSVLCFGVLYGLLSCVQVLFCDVRGKRAKGFCLWHNASQTHKHIPAGE